MSNDISQELLEQLKSEINKVLERHQVADAQACTLFLMFAAGLYAELDAEPAGFAATAQVALDRALARRQGPAAAPEQGPCGCGAPSELCVHGADIAVWVCRPCYKRLIELVRHQEGQT